MAGDLTFGGAFTTSGSNDVTLTTTGATNVTLPTSGTLMTTADALTAAQLPAVESVSFGGTVSNIGAVARWVKVPATKTDFSTAGTSNTVTGIVVPAGTILHQVKIKHSVAASGGTISAYTLSVGVTSNNTLYTAPFSVFTAVSATNYALSVPVSLSNTANAPSHTATTDIKFTATSVGDTLANATAGTFDFWLLLSACP
jgi:hypothetical protein